jgi:hypothetical protein
VARSPIRDTDVPIWTACARWFGPRSGGPVRRTGDAERSGVARAVGTRPAGQRDGCGLSVKRDGQARRTGRGVSLRARPTLKCCFRPVCAGLSLGRCGRRAMGDAKGVRLLRQQVCKRVCRFTRRRCIRVGRSRGLSGSRQTMPIRGCSIIRPKRNPIRASAFDTHSAFWLVQGHATPVERGLARTAVQVVSHPSTPTASHECG